MTSNSRRTSRRPVEHELKCWPAYFVDVLSGMKPFEVRKDDREPFFQVGDFLILNEYNPHTGYTGRALKRRVTYVLPGDQFGIEAGYVVMGLANVPDNRPTPFHELLTEDDLYCGASEAEIARPEAAR